MFNLRESYKLNKKIAKDTFISHIDVADKKRYNTAVKSIVLEAQIVGDEIPSLVNDKFNVQVIQFVKINLSKIQDVSLVARAVQLEMKAPTVITFFDEEENGRLSFATKRLSEVDKSQVVITAEILSTEFNLRFGDEFSSLAAKYLPLDKIVNKQNKMVVYQEMSVKAYILSNLKLFNGVQALLDSKIWYDSARVGAMYDCLKKIEQLKREANQSYEIAAQGRINGEIKKLIEEVCDGR